MTTEPTDVELQQLWQNSNPTNFEAISFARAVLAKWGQPSGAGEPVAWYEYARKKPSLRRLVFERTSRKDLRTAGWVAEPLYATPQPTQPQPTQPQAGAVPLPGIKPGDFFGGRPEYAMEIDPDDFYGITAAIHHAIEMLNKHKDANTDWSPLDPKRSRRLQQALMAAWILEYPKEAAAHGIKGGQHGTE